MHNPQYIYNENGERLIQVGNTVYTEQEYLVQLMEENKEVLERLKGWE